MDAFSFALILRVTDLLLLLKLNIPIMKLHQLAIFYFSAEKLLLQIHGAYSETRIGNIIR